MSNDWEVVPNLDEANAQLTKRFPKRSHVQDGGIGDAAHRQRVSSHNPDDMSGVAAEHDDHDGKHEVRARDFDKNLNDDKGKTMEDVVQLWVKLARAGVLWWVRYIIYNGRIWHRRDNFVTHAYTGSDQHKQHAHVTSDFTQAADQITGTNWHLDQLDTPKPKPPVSSPVQNRNPQLTVDGQLGPKTTKRLQQLLGVPQTGKMDTKTVRALQSKLVVVDHRLQIDGQLGPKTISALQRYLKSPVDGHISKPKSQVVMALQRRLNTGKF